MANIANIDRQLTQIQHTLDTRSGDIRNLIKDELDKYIAAASERARNIPPQPPPPALDPPPTDEGKIAIKDTKPITLHDDDRQKLEVLFGGMLLNSGSDVVKFCSQLSEVRVSTPDGVCATIHIPLDTLNRLESRRPVDTTLQELVEREIGDLFQRLIDGDR